MFVSMLKTIKEKINEYTVLLESCEEGGFTATVPSLPGCISEGNTLEEALKNIKEAIELWLDDDNDLDIESLSLYK